MSEKKKLFDSKIISTVWNFVGQNSATLAMAGSIICIGCALYAAFKASDDVSEANTKYAEEIEKIDSTASESPQNANLKVSQIKEAKMNRNLKYIYAYKWAILFGFGSAILTFLCNYWNGITIAGLTTALAIKDDKIKKLIENGRKLIGDDKFKEIENTVLESELESKGITKEKLEELMAKNFEENGDEFALKPHRYLGQIFIETHDGILFQMNKSDLEKVIQNAEDYCIRNHGLNLYKFYDMLGIIDKAPTGSKSVWWGPNNPFKVHIGRRYAFGILAESLEFDNLPSTGEYAGIPGSSEKGEPWHG